MADVRFRRSQVQSPTFDSISTRTRSLYTGSDVVYAVLCGFSMLDIQKNSTHQHFLLKLEFCNNSHGMNTRFWYYCKKTTQLKKCIRSIMWNIWYRSICFKKLPVCINRSLKKFWFDLSPFFYIQSLNLQDSREAAGESRLTHFLLD